MRHIERILRIDFKTGLGFAASFIAVNGIYVHTTGFEQEITVKDKYLRVGGDSAGISHTFMVSDKNNKQYAVSNTIWQLQFYSTELWSSLEINKTYNVKAYGIRFGFFHLFPNIYSVTEKKT